MRALDIIIAKRDNIELTDEQINWFIATYAAGDAIADEQAAALAMAIFFNGMTGRELGTWTSAMIASGRTLDLSHLSKPTVDKHSTGGVGDKLSLVLVPLLAACGACVPQLSGRGLGHTGGTLDKMEAISGWTAQLTPDAIRAQLDAVGGVIAGATADLAPADRKLYALRDVTGTVESIPLIASSIMSKKIAEGTKALVLDVKVGSGAFMGDQLAATTLARTMVELGAAHGVRTSALITRMDNVLGLAVGNALEVREALDVLQGGGPPDVVELTLALAQEMVELSGVTADPTSVLKSGAAMDAFERIVRAQGGDLSQRLPVAKHTTAIRAETSGVVQAVDARTVGVGAWRLGAGRTRKEDSVSAGAGVSCLVRPGDEVVKGQPVLELHADDVDALAGVANTIASAVRVASKPVEAMPMIIDVIRQ